MIPLPTDFSDFIRLLNRHRVRYVVVGGYAVAYHGYARYTGDIDFFVENSARNATALQRVFKDFGFDNPPPDAALFQEEKRIVRIGFPPMRVEVTNHIDGVTFAACHEHRVTARVAGIRVPFIDLEHLRKNKLAAARPKDLEDLRQLFGSGQA
ncbi:MAG: nucleotidyltransferase [Prosthecobacter sp.]|uniref:nucleotidyltransferase n=1 Tax=Prosthecobacter sp. TaxID=1965333 RepID=UPI0025D07EAF|nr:nucleotidyltransferase [Prosthecobacter sp.]MCF7788270.1 nucleotidyltransferase [Prosthecobacter sp.]